MRMPQLHTVFPSWAGTRPAPTDTVWFGMDVEVALGGCLRVFPIKCPVRRIIGDVLANAVQRFVIAEDVFLIVVLPTRQAGH